MPIGSILLVTAAVLIYLGLAHRVLDRMRLSDKAALVLIAAMIAGSYYNISLIGPPLELRLNLGGGLVPAGLVVYLIATADQPREKIRAVAAALVTGIAVYALGWLMPSGPEALPMKFIDRLYISPIVAGTVGYLTGRSRRAAFIAGTMGVTLADLAHFVENRVMGLPKAQTWIGGGGSYDSLVVAGVIAVLLAEFVGESLEKVRLRSLRKPARGAREGGSNE